MGELSDALRDLLADVRAVLGDHARRGAWAEPADPVLPDADPEAVPPPPPSPPPEVQAPPPTAATWDDLAATTRAARQPAHHDDGRGAEGLGVIRADLGDCQRCGLCEGRTELVFGVGDPDADLMIVGEGPGEQEDRKGEPFVGPAGQMLDRMLENVIGLPRSKVYIANVVKCRPPDNRNPSDQEAETCLPFLRRQIRAVQPRYMIVLGGVALQRLLGIRGITRARGTEVAWEGIPVLPTFHPAYLMRRPEDKRLVFEDLKLAKRRYDELGGRR